MKGRSSVEKLPPALRAAVDAAIEDGATIDEITASIRAGGGACSRATVARYVRRVRAQTRRQHEIEGMAEAWARALGERAEGHADLLAIETLRTLALFCVADLGERAEPVTAEDVGRLALALRRLDESETFRAQREQAAIKAAADRADRAAREAGVEGEAGSELAAPATTPVSPNLTLSHKISLSSLARSAGCSAHARPPHGA